MQNTGIFIRFGYGPDIKTRLSLIRDAGFESVMLWWGEDFPEAVPYPDVPELARKKGLLIENAHLSYLGANSLWSDGADGDGYEAWLCTAIRDAGLRGVPTLVLHVTRGWEPPAPNRRGIDRLRRAAQTAAEAGVRLALENLKRPEYLDPLLDAVRARSVGFCYDSGHEYVAYHNSATLLPKYGDRLMALHLHDNDGTADQHRLPGDGGIDLGVLRERLSHTPYRGAVTLESAGDRHAGPDRPPAEEYLRLAHERAAALRWF